MPSRRNGNPKAATPTAAASDASFDGGLPDDDLQRGGLKPSLMHRLLGYHCRRAFFKVEPFSDPRMAAFKLRPADFAVLSLLHANPGLSQKDVAQGIGVAPPNLAPVLERLEARGLLGRQRSEHDGRRQSFFLTGKGRKLCASAENEALRIEDDAAGVLSEDERSTLLFLLRKLYETPGDATRDA